MPHVHSHAGHGSGRYMRLSIVLTLVFVIGEAIAGSFAHSLALLSDAGHNLADALALLFSLSAIGIAQRPSHAGRTFGYHRVGILAALVNALSLVGIAVWIFWEAVRRLRAPEAVHSGLMIGVALAAVLLNTAISLWLHGEAKHDLNVRSAYLHMVGDALSAFGVVIAGAVVALTGTPVADPIVSFLIGGLILWSSWGILSEAVDVLLEAAPAGIDMEAVEGAIQGVPGVLNAHDLHVWTVGSGILACCCHIVVPEQSARGGQEVQRAVADLLEHHFGITHSTVQIEVEACEPGDMYCTLRRARHGHADHEHDHDHEHAHDHAGPE